MDITQIKKIILAAVASIGTGILYLVGGWDEALLTLVILMGVDYLTGLICALVFNNSPKTNTGAGSSKAGFVGLLKKVGILACVVLAVQLDKLVGTDATCRTGVILFFIGNEGLSIVENLGLMGVPMPSFIKNALELLKSKNDKAAGEESSSQEEK